ncbi:bis(5'-nucleosyl)-tetraphosphatase PrpE [asymmetrical] [Sporosarcina sp. NCCP-2222]|uniref:bis(5'-nucleosyl)-tetraphosphatase PrpE n=1 Tax=Sporosarcina sp. NCCP-2222 TaxID=2935073 RepID=UPI002080CE28|nr:bis(5'-nucleosyl)-tetraphosphatase PrpE [Sporosarcina sp. NCCP-2222]GKV54800.1 bis(5'-nucleosyl)-tetraphosphatase PrpE [asymmetrical] [Sporosarcina sp. NCCP-2222]
MKYDIIGDIHGCFAELIELITSLGYTIKNGLPIHSEGRQLAFVGDATDRGPDSLQTMQLLFSMQEAGILLYAPGNHCNKLYRYAKGNKVQQTHGLETTVAELDSLPTNKKEEFLLRYQSFYENLPLYVSLENGKLIIAHAGIPKRMIGVPVSKSIRTFVLYGDISGKTLPDGRPERRDWAKHYDGDPFIVYGHTPVPVARFVKNTVNIDTGCVFGGKLSALRYPEMEIRSVPSRQPFQPDRFTRFE